MRTIIYGLLALAPLPFASARPAWQWLWVVVISALSHYNNYDGAMGT